MGSESGEAIPSAATFPMHGSFPSRTGRREKRLSVVISYASRSIMVSESRGGASASACASWTLEAPMAWQQIAEQIESVSGFMWPMTRSGLTDIIARLHHESAVREVLAAVRRRSDNVA